MKQKINETAVMDELREGSLHFRRPAADSTTPAPATATAAAEQHKALPHAETVTALAAPPSVRTTVRSEQRVLKRHPFEFYQDQLDALKQLSLQDQLAGRKGNMSEMVREAVDEYLRTHKERAL